MCPLAYHADDFRLRIFFPRVILVDAVIEEDAGKMIDLMLEADGGIAFRPDPDEILSEQVVAGDRDAGMTPDEPLMLLGNGKAAFSLRQIGVLHGFRNNPGVGQRKFIAALFP